MVATGPHTGQLSDRYVPGGTGPYRSDQGLQLRYLPPGTSGTYQSARLSVCGPHATGRFCQKSTVGNQLKGEIDRRQSIDEEIDRRRSIEGEKGRKKKKRKKKKKKMRRKKDLSPARGPRPCAVAARRSPTPACCSGPRVAGALSPTR
ncbi:hypothetical protein GW17_00023793 [Ensete ventricosum]|nr:hypothetical protein GW17_00023793 [Ensete ventricosum]